MKWSSSRVRILPIAAGMVLAVIAAMVTCAPAETSRTEHQVEVTIVHVDKYAVYAPNLIFYLDPAMNRQKIGALTAMAERLRNKKALITYSTESDLSRDKRPLLVAIAVPPRETPSAGVPSRSEPPPGEPTPPEGAAGPARRAEEPIVERTPGAVARAPQPEEPPRTFGPGPDAGVPISKTDIVSFIYRCMDAVQDKDLNRSLACYADEVDYYSKGLVNRDFIRKDKGYYFRNWDRISASVEGDVVVIIIDQPDLRIAKFISTFEVENSKGTVRGKAENVWKIQRFAQGLKIVDEKQRILAREQLQ